MSNAGVHDFAIPHEFVQPVRDLIIIRMPYPPKKVGNVHIPDMFRDMAQHNTMTGRVVAMGPLAFTYKDAEGLKKQNVELGDWVVIRPFAGTQVSGGKVSGMFGYRYVSTFQDVIGITPKDKMPDPSILIWEESDEPAAEVSKIDPVPENIRERVIVK